MRRKILEPGTVLGPVPPKKKSQASDISVDDLLKGGLQAIKGIMKVVSQEINTGMPSRDTVMNLRDCMNMLYELKKKEKEFLDSMTDEELEKLVTDEIVKK